MLRAVGLFLNVMAVWLLLSGHYEPLIIGFGVLSALMIVGIAHRMTIIDHEGVPISLSWRAPLYWLWLGWQIFKCNLDVAWRCLSKGPNIDPVLMRLGTDQRSDLGSVIYANSITLTPGTVTLRVERDHLRIHALTAAAAQDLNDGGMERKVTRMVNSK